MIRVGSAVVWAGPPPEPELRGTVVSLSRWRRFCVVCISRVPSGNSMRVGMEYPFFTENWREE